MVGAKLHGNCKVEYFSLELATAFLMGSNNKSWTVCSFKIINIFSWVAATVALELPKPKYDGYMTMQ